MFQKKFEWVIFSKSLSKFPTLLAQYCDDTLKKTTNNDQINKKIESILKIFRYVFSKDIFIRDYEIVNL